MTKQEEIRERVIANITKACPVLLNREILGLADKILLDEASQGVVIEVFNEGKMKPSHTERSVGWVTYEPLIEA